MRKKKLDFRVDGNGCFLVTSHRTNKDGYAYFRYNGRQQRVHRLVYQECFGEIPNGLVVRHKCDVPRCINPEHLELGTTKDNYMDSVNRGRAAFARGGRNRMSKITEDQARTIKIMLREGKTVSEIMEIIGVGRKVVRAIKENKTWVYVEIPA
ncbi:hypothetical protein D3C73_924080 [compost metagenome]